MKTPGSSPRRAGSVRQAGGRKAVGSRGLGIAMVLGGVLCWSSGGVLVRLTDGIDVWQIMFYRSIVVLMVISAWIWSIHGRQSVVIVRAAGWTAAIAGIAAGVAGLSFIAALFRTTVAQTVFMIGIAPFCAALLGWWILRERVQGATWAGMMIALLGLGLMLAGGPGGGSFVGSVLALYSAFAFACYSVLLRWGQNTEMVAAQIWNALFLIPFTAIILLLPTPLRDTGGFHALMIGWHNVPLVLVMGAVQLSLGMILFTRGSRTVPAAQLSLLALAEPMLAPLWAWLVVAEVPAPATVAGGVVILSAIAVQVLLLTRRRGQFAHSLPIGHPIGQPIAQLEPRHAGQPNSPPEAPPEGADRP
ncbi:MAG TPA: DMT family transporter [Aestuariivirgaceae bacterium]|nr:DMT family transporter [Aestuariivirgaceae bacterium]